LNPCGGGERLTLVTMEAVHEMGFEIDLTTLEQPNLSKLENAFGKDLSSIMNKIRMINILNMFDDQSIRLNLQHGNYNLIVNTHGDIDPYYDSSLNPDKYIVYCHYPSAKISIENDFPDYYANHLKIKRLNHSSIFESESHSPLSSKKTNLLMSPTTKSPKTDFRINRQDEDIQMYKMWVKKTYDSMIKNSFLITNSNFSKDAILRKLDRDDTVVLSPPVNVEAIISRVKSNELCDTPSYSYRNNILVICRIEPGKKIENVIYLAVLLKRVNSRQK
jgi:hypothetical protein